MLQKLLLKSNQASKHLTEMYIPHSITFMHPYMCYYAVTTVLLRYNYVNELIFPY